MYWKTIKYACTKNWQNMHWNKLYTIKICKKKNEILTLKKKKFV